MRIVLILNNPFKYSPPVIPAQAGAAGGGEPEEQSQPPWACTQQQDGASLPVTLGIVFVISTSNNRTVPLVLWIPEQARE